MAEHTRAFFKTLRRLLEISYAGEVHGCVLEVRSDLRSGYAHEVVVIEPKAYNESISIVVTDDGIVRICNFDDENEYVIIV